MKLRIDSGGSLPENLPEDLTGHAITIDLSRVGGTESGAAAADLIRELLDRGAAKLVISEGRGARGSLTTGNLTTGNFGSGTAEAHAA